MAQVEITNVVLHYTVSPFEGVYARVRSYVGGVALKEETVNRSEDALISRAKAAGKATWDEADLVAELGDHQWALDKLELLRADPAFTAEVEKLEAKTLAAQPAEPVKP